MYQLTKAVWNMSLRKWGKKAETVRSDRVIPVRKCSDNNEVEDLAVLDWLTDETVGQYSRR